MNSSGETLGLILEKLVAICVNQIHGEELERRVYESSGERITLQRKGEIVVACHSGNQNKI